MYTTCCTMHVNCLHNSGETLMSRAKYAYSFKRCHIGLRHVEGDLEIAEGICRMRGGCYRASPCF